MVPAIDTKTMPHMLELQRGFFNRNTATSVVFIEVVVFQLESAENIGRHGQD
jgi:hypothetical protein